MKNLKIILLLIITICSCQVNGKVTPTANPTGSLSPSAVKETDPDTLYDLFDKSITVKNVRLDTVENIGLGEERLLPGFVEYSDGFQDKALNWVNSDNSIASLDKYGRIKGLKEGQVTIKAVSIYKGVESKPITVNVVNKLPGSIPTPIPTINPNKEKIAFELEEGNVATGSSTFIRLINTDGSNLNYISAYGSSKSPVWSPDATKLTFLSGYSGDRKGNIFLINTDDTGLKRLAVPGDYHWTNDNQLIGLLTLEKDNKKSAIVFLDPYTLKIKKFFRINFEFVTWPLQFSPDGKKIAFVIKLGENKFNIKIFNIDDLSLKPLLNDFNYQIGVNWSPDGKKLLYFPAFYKNKEQYLNVINIDGSNNIELLKTQRANKIKWSPDSRKLLFTIYEGEIPIGPTLHFKDTLFTINSDGTGLKKFFSLYSLGSIDWSPDGKKIAYNASLFREGKSRQEIYEDNIFTVNEDSTEEMKVTPKDGSFWSGPLWIEGGKKIAFSQNTGIVGIKIFLVNKNGTGLKRLTPEDTHTDGNERNPVLAK